MGMGWKVTRDVKGCYIRISKGSSGLCFVQDEIVEEGREQEEWEGS